MNHQFRIASLTLALGAFFLPFLAQPSSRAHVEARTPQPLQIRETTEEQRLETDQKAEQKLRREHAKFCESVREDVALGVF